MATGGSGGGYGGMSPQRQRDLVFATTLAVLVIIGLPLAFLGTVAWTGRYVPPAFPPGPNDLSEVLTNLTYLGNGTVNGSATANFSVGPLGSSLPLDYQTLQFRIGDYQGQWVLPTGNWSLVVSGSGGGTLATYHFRTTTWDVGPETLVAPGQHWSVRTGPTDLHYLELTIEATPSNWFGEVVVPIG